MNNVTGREPVLGRRVASVKTSMGTCALLYLDGDGYHQRHEQPPHLFDSLTDPVLIIGTALSVLLGVLFYFRTDLGTVMGVFATPVGITITLQVQALFIEQR